MKYIDNFLNGITMYRVVLYGLTFLILVSFGLSFLNLAPPPLNLFYSLITLLVVCFFTNTLFSKIFKVQTNVESVWISALILYFVLFPIQSWADVKTFIIVGVLAMASKYLLVLKKKHLFNPAAIALLIMSLAGSGVASWWVGSSVMFIPVFIVGFLILRKVRRFEMFGSFVFGTFLSALIFSYSGTSGINELLGGLLFSGPLLFLGTIMLTEPLTSPPDKKMQIIYGLIVGLFFGARFSFGPLYATPGLALVLGNLFAFFVSPRIRLVLSLLEKSKLSNDVWEFVWKLDQKIPFKAGQYFEWTLGHTPSDSRGNRRFFTIASSPTESVLRLGIKSYQNSSSFKRKLLSLNEGDEIVASQLAGEFTLPEDKLKKLVFIAGGIGVTPFRSMIKNLLDTNDQREVTLFYANRSSMDIVYKEIFDEALQRLLIKTVYVVNDLAGASPSSEMRVGLIDAQMIMKEVPHYKECFFYISGPHSMVEAFKETLSTLGIPKNQIKVDFFPGFV